MTTPEIRDAVALLPCPFCGGRADISYYRTESKWSHEVVKYTSVGCDHCNFSMTSEPGEELEAIDRWNTRQAPAEPKVSREVDGKAWLEAKYPAREVDEMRFGHFDMEQAYEDGHRAALSNPPADGDGWPPMADAPRDGSYILAIVAPGRGRHLEHQAGRMFVIRHEGFAPGGFDLGWAVYPGFGGCTDHNFTCWTHLPKHPFIDAARQIGEQP